MRNFLNPLFSDCRLQLIESIIEKYSSKYKSVINRPRLSNPLLIARHFPFYIALILKQGDEEYFRFYYRYIVCIKIFCPQSVNLSQFVMSVQIGNNLTNKY